MRQEEVHRQDVYICMYVCVCMYACMYVCMYVCMCVCGDDYICGDDYVYLVGNKGVLRVVGGYRLFVITSVRHGVCARVCIYVCVCLRVHDDVR